MLVFYFLVVAKLFKSLMLQAISHALQQTVILSENLRSKAENNKNMGALM